MNILANYFSDTFTIVWLALFPLTYFAHAAEEYCCGGGYSGYLFRNYCVELPPTRFLALQGFGLTLMILAIILAVSFRFPYTMLVMLASTVLINGAIHTMRGLMDGHYEPGLVTGISLWIPLGVITLLTVWGRMSTTRFLFAASMGIVANAAVELVAMRGGRLRTL